MPTTMKASRKRTPKPAAPADVKKEVQKYSAMLPWYKQLVEEIRETMTDRDKHEGDYRAHKPYRTPY